MNKFMENNKNILSRFNEWLKNNHLKSFLIIFIIGLIIRLLSLWIFIATATQDWNDMNEKVWIALNDYLLNGINPYGQEYVMQICDLVGPNANIENFYQYPPFSLIIHMPTLLWPGPSSYFTIDFMPAFFIIHFIADFYMFYRLWKVKFYGSAMGIWVFAGPLFVLFDFITFMSIPMLFIVLAYLNIDKIKRAALYISLGTATYTYLAIPALFFFIYYYKKGKLKAVKDFIIGLIPAIVVFIPFLIWNPYVFINDLFFSQGLRVSGNFINPTYGDAYWYTHLFSIPPYLNTIYNLVIDPNTQLSIPNLTPILLGIMLILALFLLIKLYLKPSKSKLIDYTFWILLGITLVAPSGFVGYLFLPVGILIFKVNKQDLFKNSKGEKPIEQTNNSV